MNLTATIGERSSLLLETGGALLLEDGTKLTLADGGNVVPLAPNSFSVDDRVDERSVARFTVVDTDRQYTFSRGQPVTITTGEDGTADVTMDSSEVTVEDTDVTMDDAGTGAGAVTTVFTGYVEEAETDEPPGVWFHNIDAIDQHYLVDKRLAAISYTNKTVKEIVTDLHDRYLKDEGVVLGNIDTGPIIELIVFQYDPVSAALTELADLAGFWWYINPGKALQFRSRTSAAAPWALTDTDVLRNPAPRLRRSAPDYRNVQWIRHVWDLTDPQTETFIGDGEQRTFTVEYDIAEEPTIRVNGSSKTVGIRGLNDGILFPSDDLFPSEQLFPGEPLPAWFWRKGEKTVTQDTSQTRLGTADTLSVDYVGMFESVIVSKDDDAVTDRETVEGGTGKVEQVARDRRIEGRAAAFELAAAKLAKFGVTGQTLQFTTRRSGLKPGMLLTVDTGLFALSDDLLIVDVQLRDLDGMELRYTVTAVEGPQDETWSKFFARLYDIPEVIGWAENESATPLVTRRFEFTKTWTEAEGPPNIFSELFPAVDLFPATDLFPVFETSSRLTHLELESASGPLGRKVLTQRDGLATDEVFTLQYLGPNDQNGEVVEAVWYGGHTATATVGSGVEVARDTLTETKTTAEAWAVVRTDSKWA